MMHGQRNIKLCSILVLLLAGEVGVMLAPLNVESKFLYDDRFVNISTST